jgi:hypothetical protein
MSYQNYKDNLLPYLNQTYSPEDEKKKEKPKAVAAPTAPPLPTPPAAFVAPPLPTPPAASPLPTLSAFTSPKTNRKQQKQTQSPTAAPPPTPPPSSSSSSSSSPVFAPIDVPSSQQVLFTSRVGAQLSQDLINLPFFGWTHDQITGFIKYIEDRHLQYSDPPDSPKYVEDMYKMLKNSFIQQSFGLPEIKFRQSTTGESSA